MAFALFAGCVTTPETDGDKLNDFTPDIPFTPDESAKGLPTRYTSDAEKTVIFADGSPETFGWADGYSNGDMFNCVWKRDNATVSDGVMSMSVKAEKVPSGNETLDYTGAEYSSKTKYPYGFYSVCMKAAKCSGVVSSFFTYTGPSSGDPWDEIDIEFLGKDMTKVQFNYYTNGEGGHEKLFDLGYDASADFHEYAFDWQPEYITWYVDGIAVYRVSDNLPSHPMKIMANVWNGIGVDGWLGALDASALPATAQYLWLAYVPNP